MSRLKEKVSTPEGVPRLFDLIKVQDERTKLAFFAALGNTVVAKDIDQVNTAFVYLVGIFFKDRLCQKKRKRKMKNLKKREVEKNMYSFRFMFFKSESDDTSKEKRNPRLLLKNDYIYMSLY